MLLLLVPSISNIYFLKRGSVPKALCIQGGSCGMGRHERARHRFHGRGAPDVWASGIREISKDV